MNQTVFLFIVGIVALAVQSSVIGKILPSELKPDLTLIVIAWSTSHVKFTIGICFSFFYGLSVDLMSGSPLGLIGLLYLFTYILFGYTDSYLEVTGAARNYLSVFFASSVIFSTLFLTRALVGDVELGWTQVYWIVMKSFSTATFSWLLFKMLNVIWVGYSKVTGTI